MRVQPVWDRVSMAARDQPAGRHARLRSGV